MDEPSTHLRLSTTGDTLPAAATAMLKNAMPALTREGDVNAPKYLARAPGRLDIIGGFADYTGASTIGMTLAAGVSATVQPRQDTYLILYGLGTIAQKSKPSEQTTTPDPISIDLALMDGPDGTAPAADVVDRLSEDTPTWVKATLGVLHQMLATGKLEEAPLGLTIILDSDVSPTDTNSHPSERHPNERNPGERHPGGASRSNLTGDGDGYLTAIGVATLLAAASAWDVHLDGNEAAAIVMRSENQFLNRPTGISTPLCILHGKSDSLIHVDGKTATTLSHFQIPPHLRLVGIRCGPSEDVALEKFARVRAASFMGLMCINEVASKGATGPSGDRYQHLSDIPLEVYTRQFRTRIPIKMTGREFLLRFPHYSDPLTTVIPELYYRIRSRSEYHIYEADRTLQFADLLTHAATVSPDGFRQSCATLMHGSHWSYGQRCGLGHAACERLVSITRSPSRPGIYGARTSCCGAGGLVAVVLENTVEADESLRAVVADYDQQPGVAPLSLVQGTSQGALQFGVHQA